MYIFILQYCVLWIQISMKLLCITINEIWLTDIFIFDRMLISDGKKPRFFKKALRKAHGSKISHTILRTSQTIFRLKSQDPSRLRVFSITDTNPNLHWSFTNLRNGETWSGQGECDRWATRARHAPMTASYASMTACDTATTACNTSGTAPLAVLILILTSIILAIIKEG